MRGERSSACFAIVVVIFIFTKPLVAICHSSIDADFIQATMKFSLAVAVSAVAASGVRAAKPVRKRTHATHRTVKKSGAAPAAAEAYHPYLDLTPEEESDAERRRLLSMSMQTTTSTTTAPAGGNALEIAGDNGEPSDVFPLGECKGAWCVTLSVVVNFITLIKKLIHELPMYYRGLR